MEPAISVAVLFRTLDAFRVFDTIFIMTAAAQDTEIGLDPRATTRLICGSTWGSGSAVSVLIFFIACVDRVPVHARRRRRMPGGRNGY